jgi:formate--tetrahydrofolate ligase
MLRSIPQLADALSLPPAAVIPWGRDRAKVDPAVLQQGPGRNGRLVLVSAINPTPAGEGKTTTSIGLAQGLARLGQRAVAALREPSLGPCFGTKGGGTGGGASRLHPSADINLHFTGDFHAVTSAHNLLASAIDNHLHHGTGPALDPRRVTWPRVLDLNDRSLRRVMVGLGGAAEGVPRETGFEITAASEIMAILCLASDAVDLRARLDRVIVGSTRAGAPVTAAEIGVTGALMALLKDALWPNLVQTVEGVPALVHGGPFANIAHGCNSVLATRLARHTADWVVTEAGFGFDLGGEKFFHIKAPQPGIGGPAVVVLVATLRALKMHGGVPLEQVDAPDAGAVARGLANLERHLEAVAAFGAPVVVTLNQRPSDTEEERSAVRVRLARLGVPFAPANPFGAGGAGCEELARAVLAAAPAEAPVPTPLYTAATPVPDKIRAVVRRVYGGRDVLLGKQARADLARIERLGFSHLPVCMARVPGSFTDDPSRAGAPRGFDITVQRVILQAGAGFLVALTGEVVRMPGLGARPQAERVDLVGGEVVGVG